MRHTTRAGALGAKALATLLCATWVLAGGAPLADNGPVLTGRVLDSAGRALQGVDVFATGLDGVGERLRARTDGRGRYTFPDVETGLYRIEVVKVGYATLVSRANTALRSTLNFVMQELERLAPRRDEVERDDSTLADLDWILRVPGRDVLQQVVEPEWDLADAGARQRAGELPEALNRAGLDEDLPWTPRPLVSGELVVTDTFASYWDASGADASRAGRSEAAAEIALRPNDRVELRLGGGAREATLGGAAAAEADLDDYSAVLRRTGRRGGELEVRAGLTDVGHRVGDGGTELSASVTGRALAAGWVSARESRRFRIDLAYLSAGVDTAETSAPESSSGRMSSLWTAQSEAALRVGAQHELALEVRAQLYQVADDVRDGSKTSDSTDSSLFTGFADDAWSVRVSGRDDWWLAEPVALSYGMEYNRSAGLVDYSYLMPKLGVIVRPRDASRVTAEVTYLVDETLAESLHGGATPPGQPARFGYGVGLEHSFRPQLAVEVNASQRPVQPDFLLEAVGALVGAADREAPVITDASAQTREVGVSLHTRFGDVVGRFGSSYGEVRGASSTTLLSAYLPVLQLEAQELRYLATGVATRYGPTQTEIVIDFRRVYDAGAAAALTPRQVLDYSVMDVALHQGLPWMPLTRLEALFVIGFEGVSVDGTPLTAAGSDGVSDELLGMYGTLHGGVALRF